MKTNNKQISNRIKIFECHDFTTEKVAISIEKLGVDIDGVIDLGLCQEFGFILSKGEVKELIKFLGNI